MMSDVVLCKNCKKKIAAKWIRKVWYHVDTGREQCFYDDLYNIDIAQPELEIM
jgi:hypothetical protein